VRFSAEGTWERIFDFGNGANDANIILARSGSGNHMTFEYWDSRSPCEVIMSNGIVANSWLSVVATYNVLTRSLKLKVGSTLQSVQCTHHPMDRTLWGTYIGRSHWNDPVFHGSIAGFYAVDAYLDDDETSMLVSRMYGGEGVVTPCLPCPPNSQKEAGDHACLCNAGYAGEGDFTCASCASATYREGLGRGTCLECPSFSTALAGSSALTACQCNAGYTGENGATCSMCNGGTYKVGSNPGT